MFLKCTLITATIMNECDRNLALNLMTLDILRYSQAKTVTEKIIHDCSACKQILLHDLQEVKYLHAHMFITIFMYPKIITNNFIEFQFAIMPIRHIKR